MEMALASSFDKTPKEEAVETIELVLRSVLAPQKFKASAEDKEKTSKFFSELLRQLA